MSSLCAQNMDNFNWKLHPAAGSVSAILDFHNASNANVTTKFYIKIGNVTVHLDKLMYRSYKLSDDSFICFGTRMGISKAPLSKVRKSFCFHWIILDSSRLSCITIVHVLTGRAWCWDVHKTKQGQRRNRIYD